MRYLILLTILIFVNFTYAGNWVINPSDDGAIDKVTSGTWVYTNSYLMCSSSTRGIAEFPVNINEQIVSASFSINPYALPLFSKTLHLYGYSSTDGFLTASDYDAGVFLGDWKLPSLAYGQDSYFDVTDFLKTVTTPYVGFNLRCEGGGDQFSSLEYNYGHPSQLSVTTIPEPATLLLLGLGAAIVRKRHK